MNKIKILIIGLLMSLGVYASATIIETDSIIYSNQITVAGGGNGLTMTNTPLNSGFPPYVANTMTSLSFDDASRTLTITANGLVRYTINDQFWYSFSTNQTVQITDTEGLHYIYYRVPDGVLIATTVPWTITGEAQIAQIYWDKVNQKCSYLGDERHTKDVTDTDHREHHFLEGAKWYSGGQLIYNITAGVPSTSGSNTVVSIQPSTIWDDDNTNSSVGLGNQSFVAYTNSGASFMSWYATGAVASVAWRTNALTYFPFMLSPDGARPVYNSLTAGVWGTNAVPEDNYFISWVVQLPVYQDGVKNGLMIIPDSAVSTSLTGAQARTYLNILQNRTIGITSEMKPMYRLTYLYNAVGGGSYSALVKSSKLIEAQDLRIGNQNPAIGVGGSAIDTSVFVLTDGTREFATQWFIDTNALVMDGMSRTNFYLTLQKPAISMESGRMWISNTNSFNQGNTRLSWYDYSDYTCSNIYWRNSSLAFFNTTLTNTTQVGTSIVYVADASGLATNNLIWLGFSNQMYRASAITGTTIYLECPLIFYEPTNNPVAKVIEFGGFPMIDRTGSNNMWGTLAFTNTLGSPLTVSGKYRYKR